MALSFIPHVIRRPVAAARNAAIELAVRRSSRSVGFAVVYHGIAPQTGDLRRELVPPHGRSLLESHLRYLEEHYQPVPPSQLLDAVKARSAGDPVPVAITFDDDLKSHVEHAAPALEKRDLPAAFFLNGAFLDKPSGYWWDRLQRAFDLGVANLPSVVGAPASAQTIQALGHHIEGLDPDERSRVGDRLLELAGADRRDAALRSDDVVGLKAAGFELGFHTLGHDPLPGLDDERLEAAMTDGRRELAELFGEELDLLAYPHGLADRRVVAAARAAGYKHAFTTDEGPILRDTHPLLIPRFTPSFASVDHFRSQIAKTLVRRPGAQTHPADDLPTVLLQRP